jgi:nucleotide-binding universal stress UspA family protein
MPVVFLAVSSGTADPSGRAGKRWRTSRGAMGAGVASTKGVGEMTVFPARVLLAIGEGRDAAAAIRAAVGLCEKVDAELHVARVARALPPHVYPNKRPEEYEGLYTLQVEDALDEITRPVEDAGGKVAGAHLRVGDDVAREVLRLGEEKGADLIVLGGRDLGLIERLVGGSVREALVARTSIPVLVVREDEKSWPPARVVVWDDSSEGARLAGELAVGIGGLYGASVVLLRVLPGGREAKEYHEDSGWPFARWAARLERLGGGRPETRPVAGASAKAALDVIAEARRRARPPSPGRRRARRPKAGAPGGRGGGARRPPTGPHRTRRQAGRRAGRRVAVARAEGGATVGGAGEEL